MQWVTAGKLIRSARKKDSFEYLFFSLCMNNNVIPIPSIKILSSFPRHGEKWKTFTYHEDPELTYFDVYVMYENYQRDGTIKKIIFRDHKITENILKCLDESLTNFKTITSLKFHNCKLMEDEIQVLYSILKSYENITDLCLDRNPLKKPLHFILLRDNQLKYLSLQHCNITEHGMVDLSEEIKKNNKLIFLDLSCNLLGDKGLIHLSNALRQNRTIVSLILVDNLITDVGIEHLMKAMTNFELNMDEIAIRRQLRFKQGLKKLEGLKRKKIKKGPRDGKGLTKRKSKDKMTTNSASTKKTSKQDTAGTVDSKTNVDYHPFVDDSFPENGEIYCRGNNKIAYLNLAYNKITERGCKFIDDAIRYQINNFNGTIEGLLDIVLTRNKLKLPDYYLEIHRLLEYKKTFEKEAENRKSIMRKSIF